MMAPEVMGHVAIPYKWKEFLFHRGYSHNVQSILRSGLVAGGREGKQGRQTIFFPPLNPLGPDPDEEKLSESKWKTNQDAVYWLYLALAQDGFPCFHKTRTSI